MTPQVEPTFSRRVSAERLWNYAAPRVLPALFVLLGVGLVVLVSARSFADTPPTPTETTLFLVLAAVCQVGGATVFGRVGRVDRNHARSAVRRVITIGSAVSRARQEMQPIEGTATSEALLAGVAQELENSIHDWNDVYGDALNDVLNERNAAWRGKR